jgi:hypothetical protein
MSGPLTVHLRVNDAATGQPTPVRLSIAGPNGTFYAPFGRSAMFPFGRGEAVGGQVAVGDKKCTCIDGSCEIRLPTGVPLQIEICKGPDYEAIQRSVTLGAGQMALRFAIERRIQINGWMSADTRCHFLSPHDALLEAAAEGLDAVHLLATEQDIPANDGHLYRTVANISAFSGQRPCLEAGEHAVVVNTFNAHPALGRLGLLHCHRPVFPLSFGDLESTDDWSLCDWADQCHRKNGLVVWCDAFRPECGLLGGEALIALLLGKVDAIEFDSRERPQGFLPFYYRLLNAGVRVPLAGASAKDSSRIALGSTRTFTFVGDDRSLGNWVEQTRAGKTFVTNGPRLELTVSGQPPGSVVAVAAGQRLLLKAAVISLTPVESLEIVANGEVIARGSAAVEREIELTESGWIAARCRGPMATDFAHTSPIYVELDRKPQKADPSAVTLLAECVNAVQDWVANHGRFERERSKTHLLDLCAAAHRILADRFGGSVTR